MSRDDLHGPWTFRRPVKVSRMVISDASAFRIWKEGTSSPKLKRNCDKRRWKWDALRYERPSELQLSLDFSKVGMQELISDLFSSI